MCFWGRESLLSDLPVMPSPSERLRQEYAPFPVTETATPLLRDTTHCILVGCPVLSDSCGSPHTQSGNVWARGLRDVDGNTHRRKSSPALHTQEPLRTVWRGRRKGATGRRKSQAGWRGGGLPYPEGTTTPGRTEERTDLHQGLPLDLT